MKLHTKLVAMMLSLLVIAILVLFIMNQYSQNDLVNEIQESSTEVSKAIQISVEDLTSESKVDPSRLKDYLKAARTKGINEINIISNEGEIIDSSDPAKVGKRREIRKSEKGLKSSPGAAPHASLHPYDLVVPVIVGDEQLGYVHINLLLDNIHTIQHDNFVKRLLANSTVFMLAIFLTIYLARRYVEPIHRLVAGVKTVSAGNLSVTLPVGSRDEIGELAESFNEMVEKLREKERLEKRLYEAEHLSKVGQLASGIAHEIRNPLNYISLAIDHIKSELQSCSVPQQGELTELADKIKDEVRRANYMVLNFMNYGRPLKLRINQVSYPELLAAVLPLLRDKLNEQRIELVCDIAPDLPPLLIDKELMRNCLINFITNAAQSMPDGGRIIAGARFDKEQDCCLLTFVDQGIGIKDEDLSKIFQPYFTTKEAGIGLGLAITERIVKEHGGAIQVESQQGHGTTFTVVLPTRREERPL